MLTRNIPQKSIRSNLDAFFVAYVINNELKLVILCPRFYF